MSSALSNASQSRPALFLLNAGKDRYVVKDASANDLQVSAEATAAILFQMPSVSEPPDELVLLQTLGGRLEVPADPSLGVVLRDSSEAQAPFLKVPSGDGFALGTPSKEYWLSVSDEGKLVYAKLTSPGASETFTTQEVPRARRPGCCGLCRPHLSKTLWNDLGHKTIVETAIQCLRELSPPTEESKKFIEMLDSDASLQTELFAGLHDADYQDALDDMSGGITYYTSHFYDPDTGNNYWGEYFAGDPGPTALERGRDFFRASLKVLEFGDGDVRFKIGRRSGGGGPLKLELVNADDLGRRRASFKMLGIALHYFTDLSQPMHAANIALYLGDHPHIFSASDTRHSDFEAHADRFVRGGCSRITPG